MQLKTGCKLFPKSWNKTWMSPSTPPYPPYPPYPSYPPYLPYPPSPPYLFVVFGFQYYSFKRTYFFCPLSSLLHQHTFLLPNFQRIFIFLSFFFDGDEFTRKRKKRREYLLGRKFFSLQSLYFFPPRGSVHPVRVYIEQTERKWSGFLQQLSSTCDLCGK